VIQFKTLRYKNFLSTGNNFTEIDFSKERTTLIVGSNGAGKSTLLDALSFVLFGKAHRNVNKPQLINSINGKDSVVEVEFVAYNQSYKIVRGIKPTIFEIWKDGNLVNQDSHNKEYQKVLEQNILKLNHKSFHQVVVLGSSSFVPFMQLGAYARREVIEDLLDINVFSKMNSVLKEKISILKDSITKNTHELELNKTKIDSQEDHVFEMEKISESAKNKLESELAEQKADLKRLENLLDESIAEQFAELETELDKLSKKKEKLEKFRYQFDAKQKTHNKDKIFFEDNDTCPTCDQEIFADTKNRKIAEIEKSKTKIESAQVELKTQFESVKIRADEVQEKYLEAYNHLSNQKEYRSNISKVRERIENIQNNISRGGQNLDSLQTAKSILEDLRASREKILSRKIELAEERDYNTVITELLKDSGIKTKIIKQYLPVINKLTNQYLRVLDFYVHFDLDESFSETIRSRHRDTFSYSSFSEGEKQRIDLALLFTWRQIAKLKNSIATNILVLDETFDSSLDADGVENLIKILDTLDKSIRIFVISHKGDLLKQEFDRTIRFEKVKNFSSIIENEEL
jgi:DNA repair exonuclease SbcCD ATPase subunit